MTINCLEKAQKSFSTPIKNLYSLFKHQNLEVLCLSLLSLTEWNRLVIYSDSSFKTNWIRDFVLIKKIESNIPGYINYNVTLKVETGE